MSGRKNPNELQFSKDKEEPEATMPQGQAMSGTSSVAATNAGPEEKPTTPSELKMASRRKADYEKTSKKSLEKDYSKFDQTSRSAQGLTFSTGYHEKKGEGYFVAQHSITEYFAFEVLLKVFGIITPKARVVSVTQDDMFFSQWKHYIIASKLISHYIPMAAVRHDVPLNKKDKEIEELREKYKIEIEKQIIIDSSGREYKISGNLFASDIPIILLSDYDAQPSGNNLGLIQRGNRFEACAIDKECASFNGENFETLSRLTFVAANDLLYRSRLLDQILSVVYEILQALKVGDNQECVFDKIFNNARVKATEALAKECKQYGENLKISAHSLVAHFEKIYGKDFLVSFSEREAIRHRIADIVLSDLSLSEEYRHYIVEDLRAPYYQAFFSDTNTDQRKRLITPADSENTELINAIIGEMRKELNLPPPVHILKK